MVTYIPLCSSIYHIYHGLVYLYFNIFITSLLKQLYEAKNELIGKLKILKDTKKRYDSAARKAIQELIAELEKISIQPNGEVSPLDDSFDTSLAGPLPTPPVKTVSGNAKLRIKANSGKE